MADIHIDDFCRDAALVLLALYNNFPRKHTVYVEDISGPDEPDEVGLHSKRYLSCLGTMLWLADEGFIRYDALIYQDGIDQSILTNKTFITLSAISDICFEHPIDPSLPESIQQEKQTVVAQIKSAIRSGSSSNISQIMHYMMSEQQKVNN